MGKDDLLFAEEGGIFASPENEKDRTETTKKSRGSGWKLLIVDDEIDMHSTTKLVLEDFEFEGRSLDFLSAYSGAEALDLLREHDDIAVILLDVVMETPDAGLNCARAIRQELGNKLTRIVLRTGQPGQAPERKVIVEYDINDYKNKTEITSQRLFTTVYTAIRSYNDLLSLEKQRQGLKCIIDASGDLFQQSSINKLAQGVLTQIEGLFKLDSSIYLSGTGITAASLNAEENSDWEFIAATGKYASCANTRQCEPLDPRVISYMRRASEEKKCLFIDNNFVGYFPTETNKHHIIFMEDCKTGKWQEIINLLQIFTTNVGIAIDNIYLKQEILDTQTEIVLRLGEVVESRSKETAHHVVRVAEFSYLLASAYGLDSTQASIIKLASPMHDVGKIGIPDSVLLKPGKLDQAEFAIMKTHTDIGLKILAGSDRVLLQTAAVIAYTHHERWDGNGYPRGLSGEDIPIEGRITALADIFDALSHERVYKKAWPLDNVVSFVKEEKGQILEPVLVDLFMEHLEEILEIKEQYRDNL